ncbi:MAG: hypothetical protein ACTSQA_06065 [Candidatus Heimdallarchaeaceae archaeon]
MDTYCQVCAEPYDVWALQDLVKEVDGGSRQDFLDGKGCPCCEWGKDAPEKTPFRAMAVGAMTDLFGDDVDGIASAMDDFEYAGMLDGFDE